MSFKTTMIVPALIFFIAASVATAQPNPCGDKMAMNPCNPCAKGTVHFHVDDPMNRNSVTFRSEAPLEDIVGTTTKITGYLAFDPMKPLKGGHGELTIPVASLNTGIPLRDEHLLSPDWLDAAGHPNITLHIKKLSNITPVKTTADFQTFDVTLVGDLMFHGKTSQVTVPGRLTYLKESERTRQKMPGDLLAARASFSIRLADFGVTGPKGSGLIGSKVGETIGIEVSLMGSSATAVMAGSAGNPCGNKAMNPCGEKKVMNPCNPCGSK